MPQKTWKFLPEIPADGRQMLSTAIFKLITSDGVPYALFLQKMNVRAITGDCMFVCHALAAEDNFLIGINFEHFTKLSLPGRMELLKHVVMHIPYGHKSSRGRSCVSQYGQDLAELAQDLVVNQQLRVDVLTDDGVNLPTPEHYGLKRGLTTDEYAQQLQKLADDAASACKNGQMPEGGLGLPIPIKMPGSNPKGFPQNPFGFTNLDPADTSDTETQTSQGMDDATKKMINNVESDLQARDKKLSLKNQGYYAGEMGEFIEALDRVASVSWRTILRRKVGKHKRVHRKASKRRPSRRNEVYWGRIKKTGVSVLVVVDTSGSMSSKELRCVQSEVKAMFQQHVHVLVTYVDAGVSKPPFEFKSSTRLEDFAGRGGTSFIPAFELYAEMGDKPDFMVYITDGYGTAPAEDPGIDLLWVLTSTGMSEEEFVSRVCNYGDVAILNVEDVENF